MNSPYASPLIVVRNYSHTYARVSCIVAVATIRGRHLFRSELLTVQLLFEGGVYSKKYGRHRFFATKQQSHVTSCTITHNHSNTYTECCVVDILL